jgi:hypothetical protein
MWDLFRWRRLRCCFFKELVQKRIAIDPAYSEALLREGTDTILSGNVDVSKAILRDYTNATVGFENLGEAIGFGSIGCLQAGVELHVSEGPS